MKVDDQSKHGLWISLASQKVADAPIPQDQLSYDMLCSDAVLYASASQHSTSSSHNDEHAENIWERGCNKSRVLGGVFFVVKNGVLCNKAAMQV